jgi:hypothetical protein
MLNMSAFAGAGAALLSATIGAGAGAGLTLGRSPQPVSAHTQNKTASKTQFRWLRGITKILN